MKLPSWLTLDNDHLMLAGRPIHELIDGHGTPCYLYSRGALEERLSLIRQNLDPRVSLKYAVKANPFEPLVQFLGSQIDGFDVASVQELEVAQRTGRTMSYSGPSKQDFELRAAVEADAVINIESKREIDRLRSICQHSSVRPRTAIRVNPDFGIGSSGLVMGGVASQFGVDVEEGEGMLSEWPDYLQWVGFHYFGGSQCLSADALGEYYRNVVNDVLRLCG